MNPIRGRLFLTKLQCADFSLSPQLWTPRWSTNRCSQKLRLQMYILWCLQKMVIAPRTTHFLSAQPRKVWIPGPRRSSLWTIFSPRVHSTHKIFAIIEWDSPLFYCVCECVYVYDGPILRLAMLLLKRSLALASVQDKSKCPRPVPQALMRSGRLFTRVSPSFYVG